MSLGVANPAGLLALAAVGVLVALYLRGRRRRIVRVATLLLWERVPAEALEARRFRPDLLFLAQLLLLLALVGGYLRPYLEHAAAPGESVRLLVVLDASASMQAREVGGTRFELARRRARSLVAQLLTGDEVMLIAAADRVHVVLRWTADHRRAQDRLEALEPLDTPTNLVPALELALGEVAAHPGTQVVVFTDLPREASGIEPGRLALVDYVQIGRTDDNLAITSLAVEAPPFHPPAGASATIVVRNYGHTPRRVSLEARVGGAPWARRELVLAARAAEPVLLTEPPAAGELVVALATDDALAVDDRAFGWLPAAEPLDVLLVSASDALAATFAGLADTVAGSRLQVLDPADYAAGPSLHARVAVFDGVIPAAPEAMPALFLDPPGGSPVCPSGRSVESAAVADWDLDHGALRGLGGLQALTLARTRRLATPPWGSAVILAATDGGAFPFLVAGERDGVRTACLGAGPVASSDDLPLLMLTVAVLRWLEEPPGRAPLEVQTGVAVLAGSGSAGAIQGLRIAGDPPVLVAERTGMYHLGERAIAANLFDDRESDIGRSGSGEWPATAHLMPEAGQGRRELGWWLYLCAAALLALEWLAWRRGLGGGNGA